MTRKSNLRTTLAIAVMMLGPAILQAHNGIEHIMGTVSAVTDKSITVLTVNHESRTVQMDSSTTFRKNDEPASLGSLKVGERVVINAKPGADKQLHGISVKWGTTSTKNGSHTGHSN